MDENIFKIRHEVTVISYRSNLEIVFVEILPKKYLPYVSYCTLFYSLLKQISSTNRRDVIIFAKTKGKNLLSHPIRITRRLISSHIICTQVATTFRSVFLCYFNFPRVRAWMRIYTQLVFLAVWFCCFSSQHIESEEALLGYNTHTHTYTSSNMFRLNEVPPAEILGCADGLRCARPSCFRIEMALESWIATRSNIFI